MRSVSAQSGSERAALRSKCPGTRYHPPGAARFSCLSPKHIKTFVLSVSENRALLVASIARGRRWLDELISDPTANTESIAQCEGCTPRKVNMTISLAFIAPDLVRAAIDGRLPHGMGVARLCDLPAEWSRQRQTIGLSAAQLPHSNRVSA